MSVDSAKSVVARLLAARESWCELEPAADGKPAQRVKLRRPAEAEMPQFYRGVSLEAVQRYAVDWDGITEATLLGDAVGAASPLAFAAEVWAEVVADRVAWVQKASDHLAAQIAAHLEAKETAAKN